MNTLSANELIIKGVNVIKSALMNHTKFLFQLKVCQNLW
jgi:hypothetical protein